jgi:hypothetical protein
MSKKSLVICLASGQYISFGDIDTDCGMEVINWFNDEHLTKSKEFDIRSSVGFEYLATLVLIREKTEAVYIRKVEPAVDTRGSSPRDNIRTNKE